MTLAGAAQRPALTMPTRFRQFGVMNNTEMEPMARALAEAEAAQGRAEVPVGAVLVDGSGRVLAANGNRIVELNDPTAHAEMLVIRAAAEIRKAEMLTFLSQVIKLIGR